MNIERSEVVDGVCRLTVNRPERRNAWTAGCGAEMVDALDWIRSSGSVRAVILTGAGDVFCSGVDLQDGFEEGPDGVPDLEGMHRRHFVPTILGLRSLPVPVVAAVQGPAVGFGAALALAADFTVMAAETYLLFAFVRLGLSLDSGSTLFLPTRAGRARATEAAMLGEPIDAARAAEWGLIHRAVAGADLGPFVEGLARRLAEGPTRAYGVIKATLDAGEGRSLADQLELEGALIQTLTGTHDFAEGVTAFGNRRKATFTGE
jgi:2-(1,2-epoxy-1,2-dihydrophenyl)acetyl-CoA isomerase